MTKSINQGKTSAVKIPSNIMHKSISAAHNSSITPRATLATQNKLKMSNMNRSINTNLNKSNNHNMNTSINSNNTGIRPPQTPNVGNVTQRNSTNKTMGL
jgi:hypothetical protein